MFGLSLPKLIVLVLVCGAIWYTLKYLQVRDRQQVRAAQRAAAEAAARAAAGPGHGPTQPLAAEDLAKCPTCGTYVARGAVACGRAGCPYPHG